MNAIARTHYKINIERRNGSTDYRSTMMEQLDDNDGITVRIDDDDIDFDWGVTKQTQD